jgi:hypothetical protein
MSAESITLITARASKLERGSRGVSEISEADISHALALINVLGAAYLLRVKIAGQEYFRPHLIAELERREQKHPRLCHIAVTEYCAPALCKTCNGRESHRVGQLLIVCPACNGSGKYRHPDPSEQIGCTDRQWRVLKQPYQDMLTRLGIWESIGIAAINSIQVDSE